MASRLYTLLFICFLSASVHAQGIEFFHGTWSEALEKSKAEGKLIFVDAFAKWCGPCKRMAAQTFPDPKVGEFFNANFIPMKMDMEEAENVEFAQKYPVGSYPTLYFIDETGKIALREIGAKDAAALLELGKRAVKSNDRSGDFEAEYTNGNREPAFVLGYISALNKAGKPSLQVTNDYLKSQPDLTTEQALKIILEGCVECDSRVFDLLVKHRKEMVALQSEQAVNDRIEAACYATLKKAIEFKYLPLLDESKNKMKQFLPEKATDFAFEADRRYYSTTKDYDGYMKVAKSFAKAMKNNPAELLDVAQEAAATFPKDKKAMDFAESSAKRAASKGNTAELYMSLGQIQQMANKKDKAIKSLQKAFKLAESNQRLGAQINEIINQLKNS